MGGGRVRFEWRMLHGRTAGVFSEEASRFATSVCQGTRDTRGRGLTESDTECSWLLLSFGCDSSRYY